MLEPMKMTKAAATVPVLRRIKRSLLLGEHWNVEE